MKMNTMVQALGLATALAALPAAAQNNNAFYGQNQNNANQNPYNGNQAPNYPNGYNNNNNNSFYGKQNQNNQNQNAYWNQNPNYANRFQNQATQNQLGTVQLANQVYGNQVISSDNQQIGNLNNLVVALESGRILYATIGTGHGRIAVPPQVFVKTPSAQANTVRVNVTKQKLDSAPNFDQADQPGKLGEASFVNQVYQHFGLQPWWTGSNPAGEGHFHNVHKASQVIGMTVLDINNSQIAKVNDLAVDLPAGRVTYILLNPTQNLNPGNNLYVLPPQAVTLSQDKQNLVTGVDRQKLADGPHFARNNWPNLSDQNFASQVYSYYGKQSYFNNAMAPTGR